jgi:predicted amidohydrolase YtcJ
MPKDLILYNGSIYTLEPAQPVAMALLIRDGRVVCCGSGDELASLAPRARRLDLAGRAVLPGFEDAHLHLCMHGMSLAQVKLAGAPSLDEALTLVRAASAQPGAGEWLLGGGWDHNLWPVAEMPTRYDLDGVAPDRPVALDSKDRHSLWVNSLALRLADVSADTPDPPGGRIRRDASGEPTGILSESARQLISGAIPPPQEADWRRAAEAALADCARYGITAVHNCEGPEALTALTVLEQAGALTARVWQMLPLRVLDQAVALGLRTGLGSDLLRIGHVKMFADGALGSATAEMLAPYEGQPDNRGVAATDTQILLEAVRLAARHGLAAAIHAIGDAANRRVLDIYAQIRQEAPEVNLRQRIEHVQLLSPEDLPRLAEMGVVASMQPIHAVHDRVMAERQWGRRCRHAYAWRSLLQSGARLAFGTDAPVEALNPLLGLYAAVTRRDADGQPPAGWYPQERLGLSEALHAYTQGAAYAAYGEHRRGRLAPGMFADLVVLSQDVWAGPPETLLETQVDLTMVGGEIVYQR